VTDVLGFGASLDGLLPDAEVREDVVEDVFGADFAGDGGEVVEGLA